jgi:hypothetical protein
MDAFQGKGALYLRDGSYYEGDFKEDNMSGTGIFYYASGDVYEGDFVAGTFTGCGTYYYANGDQYTGDYTNNQNNGFGTFTSADSIASSYNYSMGSIVSSVENVSKKEIITPVSSQAEEKKTSDGNKIISTGKQATGTICPRCNGTGKISISEVRKNKTVTKDVNNGLGPRNFVTYTINEVVRPAGMATCPRCEGEGFIFEN